MYKNSIVFCLVFILLSLSGCSKTNTASNVNLSSEQKQLKENLKKDITGRWVWAIQDGPGKGQMGFFQIQETDKNVKGRNAVLLTGFKPIPGRGGNPNIKAAIINSSLEGQLSANRKDFEFQVKTKEGEIISNKAKIENGLLMKGESKQNLDGSQISYKWTATRISNEF